MAGRHPLSVSIQITPIQGIPEAGTGDDVAELILGGLQHSGLRLQSGDIVVITHKLVSKAEGAVVALDDPGPDGHRALVEAEAAAILRRRGNLVIAETHHGFICANAGVDRSNVAPGHAVLLPRDPDASAHRARIRLERATGAALAVIITDTFGRPWRRGLVDVAIGVSGVAPIVDYRGTTDTHGNELVVTEVAVVDELAAAADLAMGKATGVPAALIRGLDLVPNDSGRARDLVRPPGEDLFR